MRHPPEKPGKNHKITAMLQDGSEENRKKEKKESNKTTRGSVVAQRLLQGNHPFLPASTSHFLNVLNNFNVSLPSHSEAVMDVSFKPELSPLGNTASHMRIQTLNS